MLGKRGFAIKMGFLVLGIMLTLLAASFLYEGYKDSIEKEFIVGLSPSVDDLVLHYEFEEPVSSTLFIDSSGSGNDGSCSGGSCLVAGEPGIIGLAAKFDGANDYLAISGKSYTEVGEIGAVSVCAWINTTDASNAFVDFDRSEYWSLGVDFGGVVDPGEVSWSTTDQSRNMDDLASSVRVDDGIWHHVCGTFNSSAVIDKKIYIDGLLDSEKDAHVTGRALGTGTDRFGFIGDGSEATSFDGNRNGYYFAGLIDDVRVYERVLSADEILELYNDAFFTDDDGDGVDNADDLCGETVEQFYLDVNAMGCPVPIVTEFDLISDLSAEDLENVSSFFLGITNTGLIEWIEEVNLTSWNGTDIVRADLDLGIEVADKMIGLDPSSLIGLNKSARLTFGNISFTDHLVLKDGAECLDCEVESYSYSNEELIVSVKGFSTYEVQNGDVGTGGTDGGEEGGGDDGGSSGGGSSGSSGGGSGGSGASNLLITYRPSFSEMESGYTRFLKEGDRVIFDISDTQADPREISVVAVDSDKIRLKIEGINDLLEIPVGKSAKGIVSSEEFYDLYVKLENIVEDRGKVTLRKIRENIEDVEIVEVEEEAPIAGSDVKEEDLSQPGKSLFSLNKKSYLYAAGFVIVIVIALSLAVIAFVMLSNYLRLKGKKAGERKKRK
tara:strand:+ start:896 stop:2893 length:1998 start_codon:yes stop_codon:yes gene_type:complete